MSRAVAAAAVVLLAGFPPVSAQRSGRATGECEAPEYFGVCEPFVPGIILFGGEDGSYRVSQAWPGGPADRTGVCPGDEVVAIGGISTSNRSFPDVLRG